MFQTTKNLVIYKELVLALLVRGFKAKYKNSFLGIFWSLLNPLLHILIFTFIFTVFIKIDIKDYPVYLLCTILPWNFFNSALINSVVSIVEDNHFVKNVFFPIETIPLAVAIVNLVNFLIDLFIMLVILVLLGYKLNGLWLYAPFLVIIEFIMVSGLAIMLAGAYVYFRDLNFILNLFLRLFFYFVPVVYISGFVPDGFRFIYLLNPLAAVIDGFGKIFYTGTAPDITLLVFSFFESVIIFVLCFWVFQRIKYVIPERI